MSLFGSEHWMYSSGGGAFYGTEIDGSLRFNRSDSAYLSRTPASASNRRTWTFSCWYKPTLAANDNNIFSCGTGSSDVGSLYFQHGGTNSLYWYDVEGGTLKWYLITTQVFRDPSAWYHVVAVVDTTNATANDRVRLYINGERVTSLSTNTQPSQNYEGRTNATKSHNICGYLNGNTSNAYLAEVNFIDGQALGPTSFGETKSGVWLPKAYSGSYGTNGYHLEFAGNTNDSSGNGNNWTANNISSYDYVPDSPTLNFATMNPIAVGDGSATLSQGNLKATFSGSAWNGVVSTIGVDSGKWYVEVVPTAWLSGGNSIIGFPQTTYTRHPGSSAYGGMKEADTGVGFNFSNSVYTQSASVTNKINVSGALNNVYGLLLDMDNRTVAVYENNVSDGSATNLEDKLTFFGAGCYGSATIYFNFGQDSSFVGNKTAQGNSDENGYGDFYYTPPSGYLALCTANFTVAEGVDPAEDNSPQDYFNTVTYGGNSSNPASVTGVGFQPDFVWVKTRSFGNTNHRLQDVVRGSNKRLMSDLTNAEIDTAGGIQSFDSDGFTVGDGTSKDGFIHFAARTFVAWNWKANGSGVSNTDGSITSTVSANTDAGFSIVSYTGSGSTTTVGHGLDQTPECIITKNRDATQYWIVQHIGLASVNYNMYLQREDSQQLDSQYTALSSTTMTVNGASVNTSGNKYISYCFHSVEGFSKFGGYRGNGSNDGAVVYTGFRPAMIIIKCKSANQPWEIFDTDRTIYNGLGIYLRPNLSNAEARDDNYPNPDFLSNGFKLRSIGGGTNDNQDYIYMAFAENPFKYANAQ